MIISISGTPGTGKSAVAKLLAKRMNANLLSISSLVDKTKHSWDNGRKTKIVNVKDLQKVVRKKIVKEKINIVEGHLSHLLDADVVIILRCNPRELKRRLEKKKWDKAKIAENVQAEILDEILIDAIGKHGRKNIFEIDTSRKAAEATAAAIKQILNNQKTKEYHAGKLDWSEEYKDYLIR